MMRSQQLTVYEPNQILKSGIGIWPEMVRELASSRELIWRLVVRDISARYRQSKLGLLWSLVAPMVFLFSFVWIRNKNFLPIEETLIPYPAFLFLGQMVWHLFAFGLTTSATSLVEAGSLLTRINFPKKVLVFSKVGLSVFEFAIRIPLLLLIFAWVGFLPKPTILFVPLLLVPLLLLVTGLGFFASAFNAVVRDVNSIIGIIVSIGIFVTPVVYPPPSSWPLSLWINYVNPLSGFVTAARDLTAVGHLTSPLSYLSSVTSSFLLFFVGWRIFHIIEPRIAEHI